MFCLLDVLYDLCTDHIKGIPNQKPRFVGLQAMAIHRGVQVGKDVSLEGYNMCVE